MNQLCKCGRPLSAGWSEYRADDDPHARCAICEAARALEGMRFTLKGVRRVERTPVLCRCGCGREAVARLRGLSAVCYRRVRHRGGVALLDRLFPLEARRG